MWLCTSAYGEKQAARRDWQGSLLRHEQLGAQPTVSNAEPAAAKCGDATNCPSVAVVPNSDRSAAVAADWHWLYIAGEKLVAMDDDAMDTQYALHQGHTTRKAAVMRSHHSLHVQKNDTARHTKHTHTRHHYAQRIASHSQPYDTARESLIWCRRGTDSRQTRVKESRLVAITTRNNTHLATEDTTRIPDTHCPATTPRTSAPPDTNAVTLPTGRQAPGLHAAVRAGVATAQSESASTAFVLLRHSTTRDWVPAPQFVEHSLHSPTKYSGTW